MKTYKWDELGDLLEPSNDESKHVVKEVVYGINLLRSVATALEQEVNVDVKLSAQVLSCLEST